MEKFELVWEHKGNSLITNITNIKEEVAKLVEPYMNYVVEDETVVDEAKGVRSNLNKIEKLINDEKKKIKKEIMKPYDDMEKIAKEAMKMIKDASSHIDNQIKEFEELWKQDKKEEIEAFFKELNFNLVTLEQIFDNRWLNKTVKEKQWQSEMKAIIHDIQTGIDSLPESDDIIVEYLNNGFDKEKAIERYEAKQKFKEELAQLNENRTFLYTVEINSTEDSEVFEALCDEYGFKIKEKI